MKRKHTSSRAFQIWFFVALFLSSAPAFSFAGITRYVDPASPTPGSGYTSWETAAHNISTGLGVMSGGDTVITQEFTGQQ